MFFFDVLSSREFLALVRYDDQGFFIAILLGITAIFVNSSIAVRDRFFRNIIFQSTTAFYFIYISISGYFVHLQTLDRYQTTLLVRHADGGIFLERLSIVAALCFIAACSAVYFPPKFRIRGIRLPTISNGDVLTTLILAGLLRNFLIFSFFLFLTLLSLDLAYLEEQTKTGRNLWSFDKADFTLRFILGYSILPVFSAFLFFRAGATIVRMTSGNLQRYRPNRLNVLVKKYQSHSSRRSFEEQTGDE